MRSIAKRLFAAALTLGVACAAALPAFADASYVYTFRPGERGTIAAPADDTHKFTANGSYAVLVSAGAELPTQPAVTVADGYFLVGFQAADDSVYGAQSTANCSQDFVAVYGLSAPGTDFAFVVNHLDVDTGAAVSAPEQGVATDGATITRGAASVVGYTANAPTSQTMTITAGGTAVNVMNFYYTANVTTNTTDNTVTTTTDGGTTVVTTTVDGGVAGAAAAGGAGAGGAGAGGAGDAGEVINPDETPLAQNPESTASSEETLTEDETPMAAAPEQAGISAGAIAGGVAVLLIAVALAAAVVLKKKKNAGQE